MPSRHRGDRMSRVNQAESTSGQTPASAGSATMQEAIHAGRAIATTVQGAIEGRLSPDQRVRLHHVVAGLAARGAYAGLLGWALNALTVNSEGLAGLAETVAGLSIGVLGVQPRVDPIVER